MNMDDYLGPKSGKDLQIFKENVPLWANYMRRVDKQDIVRSQCEKKIGWQQLDPGFDDFGPGTF